MHNSSHLDVRIIYDIKVVHFFKFIFNLGPRAVYMLRSQRHLNPALNALSGIVSTVSCLLWLGFLGKLVFQRMFSI